MGNSAGFRTFSAFRGYSAFLTPQSAKKVKYSAFSYQNSAFFVQNGIKSRRIWQVNAEFVLISAETRVSRGLTMYVYCIKVTSRITTLGTYFSIVKMISWLALR